MTKPNDGGPMYRIETPNLDREWWRYHFAGQAMASIIQSSVSSPAAAQAFLEKTKGFGGKADRTTAAIALAYADALIAAMEVERE